MLPEFFHILVAIILKFVETFGYFGIFIMTFIESTFIPVPSELTLIPAGYLIYIGTMKVIPVLFFSILGTLLGSLSNYYIAYCFGRKLLIKYGSFFFLKQDQISKLEVFFLKYGKISTLLGRMLPGIKHFISFPAGLARMNLKIFCVYTIIGSFIWILFLLYLGFVIGDNQEMINKIIKEFNITIIIIGIIIGLNLYLRYRSKKCQKKNN